MTVYDRYPIIDGTFFLSPKRHGPGSMPVKHEHRSMFLNSVCMACLEGWSTIIRCRSCKTRWTGQHLVLGTLYTYDIFAAVPCCVNRLRCLNTKCGQVAVSKKLDFFSQYSQALPCVHCKSVDYHFVKPLSAVYMADRLVTISESATSAEAVNKAMAMSNGNINRNYQLFQQYHQQQQNQKSQLDHQRNLMTRLIA